MRRRAPVARPLLAAVLSALSLTACKPFDGEAKPSADASVTASARSSSAGGTLTALSLGPVYSWDPQRIGSREDMAFATRTFLRTLTAYSSSSTVAEQSTLVGDLATDTGQASADLKTWSFTLRAGLSWQDGNPLTCEDVKYGVSRTFATKDVPGGPTYALALLDIPRNPDGTSVYAGPYATGRAAAAGIAAFNKAVNCDGTKLTFRLSTPSPDFNETVTLPAFAPYPKAHDKRKDSTYDVWSSGPYQLESAWRPSAGGTFVRNPHWKRASDPLRKALPNEVRYVEGMETQTVVQQIMADGHDGASAISLGSAPPAMQQQIESSDDLRGRSVNPGTGLVDYIAPNLKSPAMAKPEVRKALALATNRDAYVTALGGSTAATPAYSLLPKGLLAHKDTDVLGSGTAGDPAAAAALLAKAGVKTPLRITVAYRSTDTADKAMAALVAGWRQAGFDTSLRPISDDYFSAIGSKDLAAVDAFWANWAPEWASGSTVLQPLFDSRLNLTAAGTGRDYGSFADPKVNATMTKLASVRDRETREKGWGDLDADLVGKAAYIALAQRKAMYLAGTGVRNFGANEAVGGYVELAGIGVS